MTGANVREFLEQPEFADFLARADALEQELPRLRQEVQAAQESLDHQAKMVETLQERLRQAMEREKHTEEERAALATEVQDLQSKLASMRSHPEVRKAEREKLLEQIRTLSAQHAALADPQEGADGGNAEAP